MGKDRDEHKTEYDLDHLIRSSYGLGDDQILERMKIAEETVDDSQIPPEPEDGFQRLLEECDRRNLKPHFAEDYENEKEKEGEKKDERKIRCLGPLIKVALAAAVLGSVLLMTSISAGAKRSYRYEQSSRENVKNDVALNNEENNRNSGSLEKAYQEIYNQMGINVLKLGYKPKDMKYLKTAVGSRHATIYFEYKGNNFYIVQDLKTDDNSSNQISDRKEGTPVYNADIDRNIQIEAAVTSSGETEYSVQIAEGNAYYYVSGIIELEEFKNIVEDLRLSE